MTTNPWQTYTEAESDKRDYYISELLDQLTAVDQCIAYEKDWSVDPLFYSIRMITLGFLTQIMKTTLEKEVL